MVPRPTRCAPRAAAAALPAANQRRSSPLSPSSFGWSATSLLTTTTSSEPPNANQRLSSPLSPSSFGWSATSLLTTTTSSEPPNFPNYTASASPPGGGGGGAGIRASGGIALISWVEIHLLMPGDWEDLPDGVKAQLARLLGADEGSLADRDCIQTLRLKWTHNIQRLTASADADAELVSLPTGEMDTAVRDLSAWLNTPPDRRSPLLRLHTTLPDRASDDDGFSPATPAELAAERAEKAERAAEEKSPLCPPSEGIPRTPGSRCER